MNIDERLQAITMNLELLSHSFEDLASHIKRADERERQGRRAILVALRAYLEALNDDESSKDDTEDTPQ